MESTTNERNNWESLKINTVIRDQETCLLCRKFGKYVHHVICTRSSNIVKAVSLITVCKHCYNILNDALHAGGMKQSDEERLDRIPHTQRGALSTNWHSQQNKASGIQQPEPTLYLPSIENIVNFKLSQLMESHFSSFKPEALTPSIYSLTLKNGNHIHIGQSNLSQQADLSVTICSQFLPMSILPYKYLEYNSETLNVANNCTDFYYKSKFWKPSSFRIQPIKWPQLRYILSRKPGTPEQHFQGFGLDFNTASTGQWTRLINGDSEEFIPGAVCDGNIDWRRFPIETAGLVAADRFLTYVKDRAEQQGLIWETHRTAKEAMATLGFIGYVPHTYERYSEYLQSDRWAELRAQTMTRDKERCVLCTAPGTQVHHTVYPKRLGIENPASLLTVCQRCHQLLHGVLQEP